MKIREKTLLIFFLCFLTDITFTAKAQNGYPVPTKTDKLLFYFQRSHNKNTVVYELNTLTNGTINVDKPVNVSWIRYEEGGVRKELSYIQRKAFGVQWQMVDRAKESFILHFNSFKKREIYLLKLDGCNCYKTYISINGEPSELTRIYIQSENNSFGFPLSIKFIEISGINLKSRKNITERYIP